VGILLVAAWLVGNDACGQQQPGGLSQGDQPAREDAKDQLSAQLKRNPENKQALFGLGQMMVEERDFETADLLFRRYVLIAPGEPGAWAYLVRCAAGQGRQAEAESARHKVEELAPTNLALHSQTACWLADSALSEVSEHEFEVVMRLASSQTKSGAAWYSRLGQCYEQAQDSNRAARSLQVAVDLDPDTEGHYFRLARLFAREGMAGPASETMNRAMARFPGSVASRVEAGNLELEAGNPERALELERAAAALDPKSREAMSLLGRIELVQRRYTEAIGALEKAAKAGPGDAGIEFYAGQAWMKTEAGTDRAIEHFKRSLELDANRASTYYWLGSLYFYRKHEYGIATGYLEEAIERRPELEAAHQLVIQAYKRLGDEKKAAEHLRRYQGMAQTKNKAGASEK
jgi:tetratricopeptide (TPR) repeat protein